MVINHDPHSCHSCHMISLSWTLHRAESSACFSPRCAQSARGPDPSAASTAAAAAAAASGEERRGERLQSVGPALRGAVFTGHNSGQHLRTQWVLFIKVWVRIWAWPNRNDALSASLLVCWCSYRDGRSMFYFRLKSCSTPVISGYNSLSFNLNSCHAKRALCVLSLFFPHRFFFSVWKFFSK